MKEIKLNDDQLMSALRAFAQGKNSSQIIDDLVESNGWDTSYETRKALHEQLRSVNPNDARFASNKYKDAYDLEREAVVGVLVASAHDACRSTFDGLLGDLKEYDALSDSLLSMIENASGSDITSNAEFLNTMRTYVSLQRVKIEGVNAISALLEQLNKATTPVPPLVVNE